MNDGKLQMLVTDAVRLDREIREREKRLKELKKALIGEAETRTDEHTETDGGGSSWTSAGLDGCVARVTFAAPSLKSSISGEGRAIEKIREVSGPQFTRLFLQIPAYRPVAAIREVVAEVLQPKAARALLKLVTSETEPRVAFETKEGDE